MTESAYARRGLDLGMKPAAARGRSASGWHPACGQAGAPFEAPLRQYPPPPVPRASRAGDKLRSLRLRAFVF